MPGQPGVMVGNRSSSRRDWTQGSLVRNLWNLSWPAMVTQVLYVFGLVVDLVFIAKLGPAPTAGAGIGGMVVIIVVAGLSGLGTGVRAIIARRYGAGDAAGAAHAAEQSILVSIGYGVIIGAALFSLASPVMSLFGVAAAVAHEGAAYLQIWGIAAIPLSIYTMNFSIMQASGDTASPMKIMILVRALHLVVDPFLIFGLWIFPRLEVRGAALTSVITLSLALVLTSVIVAKKQYVRSTLSRFRPNLGMLWRITKVGFPASIMGVQRSFSNLVLTSFMVPFGTAAVASHLVIQRVDMVLTMVTTGLGIASGVLAAHYLGARQLDKAGKSGWLAVGMGTSIMLICSMPLLLWPEIVVHIFTSDPSLVAMASAFLRIAAVGYMCQSFSAVLQGTISGTGDTVATMVLTLAMTWAIQIPAAYAMSRMGYLSVYGVRWAMVASLVFGGIIFIVYYWRGKWKTRKV